MTPTLLDRRHFLGHTGTGLGAIALASYLLVTDGLLALVPLLTEKDDPEVQWHAKHGIVLMVAELFFWVAVTVVQMIMPILLGCFVGLLSVIVWLGILGLHIACIAKGISGQRLIVPGVTPYVDRF